MDESLRRELAENAVVYEQDGNYNAAVKRYLRIGDFASAIRCVRKQQDERWIYISEYDLQQFQGFPSWRQFIEELIDTGKFDFDLPKVLSQVGEQELAARAAAKRVQTERSPDNRRFALYEAGRYWESLDPVRSRSFFAEAFVLEWGRFGFVQGLQLNWAYEKGILNAVLSQLATEAAAMSVSSWNGDEFDAWARTDGFRQFWLQAVQKDPQQGLRWLLHTESRVSARHPDVVWECFYQVIGCGNFPGDSLLSYLGQAVYILGKSGDGEFMRSKL
jgi:hypothetical protein